MVSRRESYSILLTPMDTLHFGMACLHGPLSGGYLQMFYFLGCSIGSYQHEIGGCEQKLQIWSFNMGAKALARNETNHLVWVRHIFVTLFGTLFICHQWGSLSDVGTPPTWEKGSHLPPGTTKLGNLRDSHKSFTAPTAEPDPGFLSSVLSPSRDDRNMTGCTGMLGELVGSHTKVAIYPIYAIQCERL